MRERLIDHQKEQVTYHPRTTADQRNAPPETEKIYQQKQHQKGWALVSVGKLRSSYSEKFNAHNHLKM